MGINLKRPLIILLSIGFLLMIPFIAMQFSDQVNWSSMDFLVMGLLLGILGTVVEFIMRGVKNLRTRWAILFFVLLVFLLGWTELAVGILGTPFAGS